VRLWRLRRTRRHRQLTCRWSCLVPQKVAPRIKRAEAKPGVRLELLLADGCILLPLLIAVILRQRSKTDMIGAPRGGSFELRAALSLAKLYHNGPTRRRPCRARVCAQGASASGWHRQLTCRWSCLVPQNEKPDSLAEARFKLRWQQRAEKFFFYGHPGILRHRTRRSSRAAFGTGPLRRSE
jgi:hypothetical protein